LLAAAHAGLYLGSPRDPFVGTVIELINRGAAGYHANLSDEGCCHTLTSRVFCNKLIGHHHWQYQFYLPQVLTHAVELEGRNRHHFIILTRHSFNTSKFMHLSHFISHHIFLFGPGKRKHNQDVESKRLVGRLLSICV
jgi:hypothetical protein